MSAFIVVPAHDSHKKWHFIGCYFSWLGFFLGKSSLIFFKNIYQEGLKFPSPGGVLGLRLVQSTGREFSGLIGSPLRGLVSDIFRTTTHRITIRLVTKSFFSNLICARIVTREKHKQTSKWILTPLPRLRNGRTPFQIQYTLFLEKDIHSPYTAPHFPTDSVEITNHVTVHVTGKDWLLPEVTRWGRFSYLPRTFDCTFFDFPGEYWFDDCDRELMA